MNDGRARVADEEEDGGLPLWWSPWPHQWDDALFGPCRFCGSYDKNLGAECPVRAATAAVVAAQEVTTEDEPIADDGQESYEETVRSVTPRPASWDGVIGNAVAVEQLHVDVRLAAREALEEGR
jgi:hypothetical protein